LRFRCATNENQNRIISQGDQKPKNAEERKDLEIQTWLAEKEKVVGKENTTCWQTPTTHTHDSKKLLVVEAGRKGITDIMLRQ